MTEGAAIRPVVARSFRIQNWPTADVPLLADAGQQMPSRIAPEALQSSHFVHFDFSDPLHRFDRRLCEIELASCSVISWF